MPPATRPYHHGDLRPALLRAAVETIMEAGPAAMSLREVARRAGVTHAAAAYHFGDKAGLFTAIAAEGYRELGEALREATATPDAGQLAAGVAAWSLVHGIATLWLNGSLPPQLGHDPEEITRV